MFGVKSITTCTFANRLIKNLAVLFITTTICYSDLDWNDEKHCPHGKEDDKEDGDDGDYEEDDEDENDEEDDSNPLNNPLRNHQIHSFDFVKSSAASVAESLVADKTTAPLSLKQT